MKKIRILVSIAFIVMSFTAVSAQEKYEVAAESSTITWKGYKPTGSHNGTIALESGFLSMQGKYIAGGTLTANMTSIKDADGSAKLEGHLKSKDFFEVETFPTAKFAISEVEMDENGAAIIKGNITIKGITKEISFSGEVSKTANSVTLKSAVFSINRADFNVKFKSKSFFNDLKDKFINDEFDLQVTIVANK
ncbi:YceI family protein [Lutibacter sp. A80]|uniref:YceI family protein n=1 Tax=Lutibacter sp. A80 TaxID=2918453 RepID=UPI001F067FA7|nr:YceI family protein [Lutibacter sp. A80]UMB60131.1 YceI family protein [Lutibacter sp. A80]